METMTFSDIFKQSFLNSGGLTQGLTAAVMGRAVIYILLSVVIGVLLYVLYRKTYSGVVYSRAFAVSILGMTVLTCAIIVTIQSNVVLSLGMVGALSIVRYRTAVKDPMDLFYLFWAVASGIATGAGMFLIALFVFVVMAVILLILSHVKGRRDEMYILLVHYNGDGMEETIRRAIVCVREHGSAITVVPASETIIIGQESGEVTEIFDRSRCQLARAPQCFYLDEILAEQRQAISEGKTNFIDSCSLMKYYGHALYMIDGPYENIKITTPDDYYSLRAILEAKENAQIYGME